MSVELYELRDGWADLCYSPDDNKWYAQRHADDFATGMYDSREELVRALRDGSAEWGDD